MESVLVAKRIKCLGKVQGVFYRASTQEEANKLKVKGWVRNEPDGSVLIHAESTQENITRLIDWCKKGPMLAKVSEVMIENTEVMGFGDFVISR